MDETGCTSRAYFDTSDISRTTAALSLSKTIFVMLLLVSFSIVFSNDAQALVVSPVERMMSVVSNLADNPLAALDNGASEESHISGDLYDDDAVETAILENILRKIGSLLQVGFGPAGASIIAKNIGHGELRALEPGRMVTSVFGFVCIKDFTSIVACLEEDMTRYVNAIAAIVHRGVHHGFGAANKNIGSSFLFAWKICDGLLTSPQQCSGVSPKQHLKGAGNVSREVGPTEIVDNAIASFIRARVDVFNGNRSGEFADFFHHPKIAASYGKDFEVQLSFGMHVGWAIEGAIGSKFKIDASYLSPNVNIAARLASSTSQFQTQMLLSEDIYNMASAGAREKLRVIDKVTLKGSQKTLEARRV